MTYFQAIIRYYLTFFRYKNMKKLDSNQAFFQFFLQKMLFS